MRTLLYDAAMRVAEIRKARGWTQTQLAERVGVEQPTISRLERGHDSITLRLLREVAQALDVTLVDLLLDERSAAEQELLSAYRSLPAERRQGWNDLAKALASAANAPSERSA